VAILGRAKNLVTAAWHYLRWKPRLGGFCFRSRLEKPRLLTNPRLITIGAKVMVRAGARLEAVGDYSAHRPKIVIGDGARIQYDFHCGAAESVIIGEKVTISGRVYISDHDHLFDHPTLSVAQTKELVSAPVEIKDGAWLGEGCVILKGVTVGVRAVVGANAVVTKDVPDWTVVGGIPARVIRKIEPGNREEKS